MVRPRRAETIGGTIATSARRRPKYSRPQRCLWPSCGAVLPHDHPSPICSCHTEGYRLEHDKHATELVLHLLLAAYPDAINLTAVLGASKNSVRDRIYYLRRRGHIIGSSPHGHGYWYEAPPNASRRGSGAHSVGAKAGGAHA